MGEQEELNSIVLENTVVGSFGNNLQAKDHLAHRQRKARDRLLKNFH